MIHSLISLEQRSPVQPGVQLQVNALNASCGAGKGPVHYETGTNTGVNGCTYIASCSILTEVVHALVSLHLTGWRVPAIRTHTEETAQLVLRERVCQCQLLRACLGAVCVVCKNLHSRCHHSCMEQMHTRPLQSHSSYQSRLDHSHMCTSLSDPVILQRGEGRGRTEGKERGGRREKRREERRNRIFSSSFSWGWPTLQVPPFMHGFPAHSLMSFSQSVPS